MTGRRGEIIGFALATTWLVAAVVLDVVEAGPTLLVVVLFAVAPLIASAALPPRVTAGFAVAAVVLALGSGWWDSTWGANQQLIRVFDVVIVSIAAVLVSGVRVRRERQYARMVAIAYVAQRAILPTLPAKVGGVAVSSRYLSAAEDALVGGDLYDYYHSEGCTRFLVGDVRGKGIGAVEQAARVIRAFRQSAASASDLVAVAEQMNAYLVPFLDDEEFVTALLVDVTDLARLTVVSCGHPPPLLTKADGRATFLDPPPGLPLGLGQDYAALTVTWSHGDRLLVYTDGLSEARDARGQFLSPLSLAPALSAGSVDEALDSVLDATRGHVPAGELTDDLAVLLLENLATDLVSPAGLRARLRVPVPPAAARPRGTSRARPA